MSSEVKLSEVAEITMGTSPKGEYINETGEGTPFFQGSAEFTDRYPIVQKYTTQPKRNAKKGDILFSVRAPVGSINISNTDCAIGRGLCAIRAKNDQDQEYLEYAIKQRNNYWGAINDSGSVFGNAKKSDMHNFLIKWPTDPIIRKSIASQLASLDKKIQINKRANETLEAIAQAIFKSWFVDFDPVRAKIEATSAGRDPNRAAMAAIAGISLEDQDWDEIEAALEQKLTSMSEAQQRQLSRTAELFPDELVESEIGEVPKGWEVKIAEDILKRFRAPKRVKKDEVEETGKVVVLEQGEGIIMGYHNEEAGYDASPDNPYFIFGDHTCITHLVIEPFDIAPNVIPLQGEEFDSYWTYYAIRDLQQFQEYRRHWSELKVKEVVTPNNELDELFAEFIKPLIIKINKNRNENLTLSQLRDTLLPKLISGELELN
ncbi:restriction endonuclease subunit S [Gracilimonas halophila]|uniref:Restriction endonuclease subunit S n=1 Tax=Gracilimonas halophila TaxID=1834464 RepID=A0ABW5JKH1_9BACT